MAGTAGPPGYSTRVPAVQHPRYAFVVSEVPLIPPPPEEPNKVRSLSVAPPSAIASIEDSRDLRVFTHRLKVDLIACVVTGAVFNPPLSNRFPCASTNDSARHKSQTIEGGSTD